MQESNHFEDKQYYDALMVIAISYFRTIYFMIEQKNTLIRKFSLFSIVIIILLGVILNLVISYKIENMLWNEQKYTTASIVETHARNHYLTDQIKDKENNSKEGKKFFETFYNSLKPMR